MLLTTELLKKICPLARSERLDPFVEPMNAAMAEFQIDTPKRQAAFIAQLAHESGSFRYVKELASGEAYEGRADLGNTEDGDGVRYKGRGLIQITGRANYLACGTALGVDLVAEPELLEQPEYACRSAAWFWHSRRLSELADASDFIKITRRINGGVNGLADRLAYWERAKITLEVT
ncbi:MAG: glycoside hydrolase family 19 protein [Bellilinea sp.]